MSKNQDNTISWHFKCMTQCVRSFTVRYLQRYTIDHGLSLFASVTLASASS